MIKNNERAFRLEELFFMGFIFKVFIFNLIQTIVLEKE
jgi:hypothetical protein